MRTNPGSRVTLAVLVALLLATSAIAQVRRVHPDGNDSFDGTSWVDEGGGVGPWKTLRHALQELNEAEVQRFDEIWLAMGETGFFYTADDDDLDVSFLIEKPIVIRGGFQGPSTEFTSGEDDPGDRHPGAVSVLSGDLPDSTDWSLRIIKIAGLSSGDRVELDALKFVGPNWFTNPEIIGGGIETLSAESPPDPEVYGPVFIHDCVFDGCRSGSDTGDAYGGAVRAHHRFVRLRDCVFTENAAKETGFGTGQGGAVSMDQGELRAARCQFEGNFAGAAGGAVWISHSPAILVNCDLRGNTVKDYGSASGGGGAIAHFPDLFTEVDVQRLTVNNCVFADNVAGPLGGGAIFAQRGASIAESTFYGNTTTGYGGGISGAVTAVSTCTEFELTISITNSIFWANDDGTAGGDLSNQYGFDPNCTEGDPPVVSVTLISEFNCVQATEVPDGDGNINTDPRFVDETSRDLRLRRYSPAINTGDESIRPADIEDVNDDTYMDDLQPLDLDLTDRFKGPEIDMGAYEGPPCLADLNGDGTVNGADMGILLGTWNCTGDCAADLNGDGVVNGADLGLLLAGWGTCPGHGESMMMEGGGSGMTPDDLMALLGAGSIEELVGDLLELDHEQMVALLGMLGGT